VPDSPPLPCAPPPLNAPPEPLFPPEAASPPAPLVPPASVRPPECPPTWLLPPLVPAVPDAGLLQAPAAASARTESAPQRRNCPTHGEEVFMGDSLRLFRHQFQEGSKHLLATDLPCCAKVAGGFRRGFSGAAVVAPGPGCQGAVQLGHEPAWLERRGFRMS
jgi:hypothetical protein